MMRPSVKACLRLLCGISVLFSVEGQSTASATPTANATSVLLTSEIPAAAATAHVTATRTEEARVRGSNGSVAGSVAVTTAMLRTPAAVTPASPTGDAQPPRHTTVSETSKPTEDKLHRGSSITSSDGATIVITPAASSTSTTKPEVTSNLSPTNTSSFSTRAVTNSSTVTSPVMTTETLNTSTTTSHPTSQFPKTAGSTSPTDTSPASVSNSSSSSTSAVSTSPAGIYPKRLTSPSTTSAIATPCKVSDVQPCSARDLISPCLIALASLAVLATIFMVSTVVLCTKLSSRRYKVRRHKQSTEMMCISALLPEEDVTYTRRRPPIANGILVIPSSGDSEEEGGDNVTLSSFLPENDHYL